jgi:hypothetical protein
MIFTYFKNSDKVVFWEGEGIPTIFDWKYLPLVDFYVGF